MSVVKVAPADVRKILGGTGDTLHYVGCSALALDSGEWPDLFRFTDDELDDLAGPVARIVNRHAALARIAQSSDEVLVAVALGRYVLRNAVEARAAVAIASAELGPDELATEPDPTTSEVGFGVRNEEPGQSASVSGDGAQGRQPAS